MFLSAAVPAAFLLAGTVVGKLGFALAAYAPAFAAPLAAILALTTAVGVGLQSRSRASRRWRAALDAYAEREIARSGRRRPPSGWGAASCPVVLPPGPSTPGIAGRPSAAATSP
jgi:hypothetical protein